MSKQKLAVLEKCLICDLEGKAEAVQKSEGGGILFRMVHIDGKVHTWTEYRSMQAILENIRHKREKGPRTIVCPICNKKGRLNEYHPRDEIRYHKERYVVVHEKLKGTWGKSKVAKRRRCYITNPNDRVAVLKKLRRYIPPKITLEEYPK